VAKFNQLATKLKEPTMKRLPLILLSLRAGLPMLAQSPALTVTSASDDSRLTAYGILDIAVARIAH